MKITVYDYSGARNCCAAHQQIRMREFYADKDPVVFEPDAQVVGGEEGVLAYWVEDNLLYEAHGDDGHWWLASVIHIDWLIEIEEALKRIKRG